MKLYQHTHIHKHTHIHTLYTQSSQQTCDDDIKNAQSGFILDHDNRYGKLAQLGDQPKEYSTQPQKANKREKVLHLILLLITKSATYNTHPTYITLSNNKNLS